MRNEEWLTPMGIIAYSSEYLQERGGHGGLSLLLGGKCLPPSNKEINMLSLHFANLELALARR